QRGAAALALNPFPTRRSSDLEPHSRCTAFARAVDCPAFRREVGYTQPVGASGQNTRRQVPSKPSGDLPCEASLRILRAGSVRTMRFFMSLRQHLEWARSRLLV